MKKYTTPEIELTYFEDVVELEGASYNDNESDVSGYDEWWT